MTQRSTPYDGIRPSNIDGGPYSSYDVLNERRKSSIGGVIGCIVDPSFNISNIVIDNINKIITFNVNNLHVLVDGTTVYADAAIPLSINYAHIPLNSTMIMFQVGVLVNRDEDLNTHDGVLPRTARVIGKAYSDEFGMYDQESTDRNVGGVFIMPITTLFYNMNSDNVLDESSLVRYISKQGVDWILLNTFRDGAVRGSWPAPFDVHNWNTVTFSGVLNEILPRLIIDMSPLVSITTYADGVDTNSSIHRFPSGEEVIYFDLIAGQIDPVLQLCHFTLTITANGLVSGVSSVFSKLGNNAETYVLSGIIDFGVSNPSIHDFVESLYNTTGAEITMETT